MGRAQRDSGLRLQLQAGGKVTTTWELLQQSLKLFFPAREGSSLARWLARLLRAFKPLVVNESIFRNFAKAQASFLILSVNLNRFVLKGNCHYYKLENQRKGNNDIEFQLATAVILKL